MDELRFGVIGTGMMGLEHLGNLSVLDGVRITALSDPHPGSLAGAAAFIDGRSDDGASGGGTPDDGVAVVGNGVACFSDHRDLLASGLVDAMIIASPNHTHRAVLEDCWGSGVHLFVEKPLCTTVDDAVAVAAAARGHDGLVWMGLEYRYFPAVDELLREVRGGAAGRVHMVAIREHRYPFLVKVGDWNRFSVNTGGTLVEKCCHFFDLMNQIVGVPPVRVYASGAQDVNHLDEVYDGRPADILDNAFVIVDYPDGVRGALDLCMFAEGSHWEQELSVVGDAGKVEAQVPGFTEVARGAVPRITVGSRGPDWPVTTRDITYDDRVGRLGTHHGASYVELERFCAAVRNGTPPEVTVEDGVLSVAVGAAAHRSIDEGRPVELAEFDLGS